MLSLRNNITDKDSLSHSDSINNNKAEQELAEEGDWADGVRGAPQWELSGSLACQADGGGRLRCSKCWTGLQIQTWS